MGDYGAKGVDIAGSVEAKKELLRLVRTWRERLGPERILLDEYLDGFLRAMTGASNTFKTAGAGYDEAFAELRGLIRDTGEGKNEARQHPFYPRVKAYMDAHPFTQDGLYYETCCVAMLAEYAPYAARQYMEKCEARFQEALSDGNLRQLRDALLSTGVAIMAEGLDYLHVLIGQLFVLTPPFNIFIQGMLDKALLMLAEQEDNNGATVLRRLIDSDIE